MANCNRHTNESGELPDALNSTFVAAYNKYPFANFQFFNLYGYDGIFGGTKIHHVKPMQTYQQNFSGKALS